MNHEEILRRLSKAKGVRVVETTPPPTSAPDTASQGRTPEAYHAAPVRTELSKDVEWVTAREISRRLGVSRQRVYQILSRGDAPLAAHEHPSHPYHNMPHPLPHGIPALYDWAGFVAWREECRRDGEEVG